MVLLDITITNEWATFLGIAALLFIIAYISTNRELNKLKIKSGQQELTFKKQSAELKLEYQQWAFSEFEKFKSEETSKIEKAAQDRSRQAALAMLQEWKIENEAKIRQDAINRSYSVNLGKITEHLVPFHSSFLSQFNPKDARFIGSPIDLIVFDGYADKKEEIIIYLVEIKTGNSRLTEIQKKIMTTVLKGEIRWAEINTDNPDASQIIKSSLPDLKKFNI